MTMYPNTAPFRRPLFQEGGKAIAFVLVGLLAGIGLSSLAPLAIDFSGGDPNPGLIFPTEDWHGNVRRSAP